MLPWFRAATGDRRSGSAVTGDRSSGSAVTGERSSAGAEIETDAGRSDACASLGRQEIGNDSVAESHASELSDCVETREGTADLSLVLLDKQVHHSG